VGPKLQKNVVVKDNVTFQTTQQPKYTSKMVWEVGYYFIKYQCICQRNNANRFVKMLNAARN